MESSQPAEKYVVWMGAKGMETYSKSDLKEMNEKSFNPPPELKDNNWANGGNFESFNTFFFFPVLEVVTYLDKEYI